MTKKTSETGILLMAFGKPQYAQMAFNMALSIKAHGTTARIQLVHDDSIKGLRHDQLWPFDILTPIKHDDLYSGASMNPGRAKTRMDYYTDFENTIYLDVDGICLKPIQPLIDHMDALSGYYYVQSANWYEPSNAVPTHNLKRDGLAFPQMQWALPEKIWQVHNLKEDAEVTAINSSFTYFRKNESKAFFDSVRDNIDNGLKPGEYSLLWGGTYPDELAFNIACAQHEVNPSAMLNPIWFQFGKPLTKPAEMTANYYFLGLYGGAHVTHSSAGDYYDRLMFGYCRNMGLTHQFKWHFLSKAKHQGKSTQLKRLN